MDKHGGGRFQSCASRDQARLEKPIERPCDRNHCNDFETRQIFFAEIAARYDHWLGSPQENAAVGIKLS